MDSGKITGIIIILALILSVIFVGYNTVTGITDSEESAVVTTQTLDESEINQTFTQDDDSSITNVNININQKIGGTRIEFADNSSTIYNITSENEKNTKTAVTTTQNNSTLDVNIDSEESDNTIILSDKYNYTINGEIITGGFYTNFNNNAKVDEINLNITAGGIDLEFNGGSLNTLNASITTGGLNINGEPNGETLIYSKIDVGGLNLQVNNAIADVFSDIEVGGINSGDYEKIGENEYKGNQFDSSQNRFIIHNNIKLGGLNTQSFE